MLKAKRVLWGEGMFLRPQHFQQQALYLDGAVTEAQQSLQRHAWGLRELELDAGVLTNGLVNVNKLDVTFNDGTRFRAPGCEPAPLSRNLNDVPQAGVEAFLCACLPNLDPHGNNTAASPETPVTRPTRYRNAREIVADLYTHSLEADITVLDLDVRLMFHMENRDGYDSVPIARLVKDATGKWQQDEDWLPPLVTVSGAPSLARMIRRMLDILLVKSKALTRSHREQSKNVVGYGTADIASFWMLHTANHYFARLKHLSTSEPLHPEELYLELAGFLGELLTFSHAYALEDVPTYQHEELNKTFPRMEALIHELLDTVISSRYVVIPLTNPKPSFYIGHLDSDRLIENVDFYLSVQGELPVSQIIEVLPLQIKAGAPDDVERILHSATRGVNLTYTMQTPSALPVRVGNHYFSFEQLGPIYRNMLKSRSVCLYVPEAFTNLKFELIAVFR
jgi:type VI secretion system protein ImpJ